MIDPYGRDQGYIPVKYTDAILHGIFSAGFILLLVVKYRQDR